MNKIPTPQESAKINWEIVDFETFWWNIQEWITWPYSNNFFASFDKSRTIKELKDFLDENAENFSRKNIMRYTLKRQPSKEKWDNWSITYKSIYREFIRYLSFSEYYRAFPNECENLFKMTAGFENLSTEISNQVCWRVNHLTNQYMEWLYNAYAYMRTEPWTSDAMLTA